MTKKPMTNNNIPNGTLVTVISAYPCKGQVCGSKENFIGLFYDVVILESSLFHNGEIMSIHADYLLPT